MKATINPNTATVTFCNGKVESYNHAALIAVITDLEKAGYSVICLPLR